MKQRKRRHPAAAVAMAAAVLCGLTQAWAAPSTPGRILGLVQTDVACAVSPSLELDERCRAEDFDFSKSPIADYLGVRLQLKLRKGGARWVRRSSVKFYAEELSASPGRQPRSNGTQISAPKGDTGEFLKRLDGTIIDPGPGKRMFTLSPTEANRLSTYRQTRLALPVEEELLTTMVEQLDAGWPYDRRPLPRIVIIASQNYTAAALPDDAIVVPLGLLLAARSDDELAFVLAHELAHFRLGHFAADLAKEQRIAQVNTTANVSTAVLLAGVLLADKKGAKRALAGLALAAQVAKWIYARPQWSRPKEDDADMAAFDLVQAAGYCPLRAAQSVFAAVAEEEIKASGVSPSQQRSSDDEEAIYLRAVHDRASQRIDRLTAYARSGGRASACQPRTELVTRLGKSLQLPQAQRALEALEKVSRLQQPTDPEFTLSTLKLALVEPYRRTPAIAGKAAAAYAERGERDKALELYKGIPASEQASPMLVDYARTLIADEQYSEARVVLQAVSARTDAPSTYLPLLVSADLHSNDGQQASASLSRCLAEGPKPIRTQCGVIYLDSRATWQAAVSGDELTRLDKLVKKRAPKAKATLR